jgi:16S rRNA U1498 N3-methylase RsmE
MQWRIRSTACCACSAGDWICLLDGAGGVFLAQLGERGRIATLQPSALATELPFAVTVLQALVRPEKAETAIRLCVQAGAQRDLVRAQRAVGRPAGACQAALARGALATDRAGGGGTRMP